ncbi:MAG: hypothetical protein RR162_02845 [Oscillospiraceae bacterium]
MDFSLEFFKKNVKKNVILAVFFVAYIIIFLFMFFSKGIFINDNFYKKSANINTITYTCRKNAAPKQVVVQKQIDGGGRIVADGSIITLLPDGTVVYPEGFDSAILEQSTIKALVLQQGETHRGDGNFTWIFVAIIYIAFMLLKRYNTQIYAIFNRNKAPGESYYRYFDAGFTIFCIAALIYLIVTL